VGHALIPSVAGPVEIEWSVDAQSTSPTRRNSAPVAGQARRRFPDDERLAPNRRTLLVVGGEGLVGVAIDVAEDRFAAGRQDVGDLRECVTRPVAGRARTAHPESKMRVGHRATGVPASNEVPAAVTGTAISLASGARK